MKILIAHNAYQQQSGEGVAFRNESDLLRRAGHEVGEWLEDNRKINAMNRLELCARTIWSEPSRHNLRVLLERFRPDVVHFHNTFPLISPAAYYACHELRIPVVQTLHNYRLLCPKAVLYRQGSVCEDCIGKRVKWPAVVHACYRDSRPATSVVAAMLAVHESLGTWARKIGRYIAPSEFARRKFIEGGLPAARIAVKPNFVPSDPGVRQRVGDVALFAGRLSSEKGLRTLLLAWSQGNSSFPLRIVGDGPLREDLKRETLAMGLSRVYFDGAVEPERVLDVIKHARFLVVPSGCYETFSLVTAEAFACGVPVIAARLGALSEIVRDGVTGLHFEPESAGDLAEKLRWAWTHPSDLREMGRAARAEYEAKYTAERNIAILLDVYEQAIADVSTVHKKSRKQTTQPRPVVATDSAALPAFHVLGVRVDSVQIPTVIARMNDWIRQAALGRWIAVAGMHGITEAQHKEPFKGILNRADLVVPDGMTLVWCGRIHGRPLARRVYGPELMLTFCRETAKDGHRHFLYGGGPSVAERLAANLRRSCPGINIVGTFSPSFGPLPPEEDARAVAMIRSAAPDVLWVGLGTPKQEEWIDEHRGILDVPVLVGVGAAFDILSANKRQAPEWMREHGLEWLFRLLQEPRRLWKRYLLYGPQFILLAALEMTGLWQFE